MKKQLSYILFILLIVSCNSVKRVADNELLLTKNTIIIDSVKTNGTDIQKYILQKPNNKTLGIPLSLYFYNLGDINKPLTPTEWSKKNPKSYKFIKSVFSEKQAIGYANSFINLNKWYLRNGQAPVIIDDVKVRRTVNNLKAYYQTQGFFQAEVFAKKDSVAKKKGEITYNIKKGNPLFLDEISSEINSPFLDSLYQETKNESLLKSGAQYKDQNFRNEAKRLIKLFRNNGVYHFSENYMVFAEIDTSRNDYLTNVVLEIDDQLVENKGVYTRKPFKSQKVSKINVVTDYSFQRKNQKYKDSAVYKGVNFYAYEKLRYNPQYLYQSIFLKPDNIYKDTLRNLTRSHLKSLKNFKTTSIKFEDLNDDELKADILLTPTEKYSLGLETEITHSNIREIGASAKFSINNRNTFRGAELFKLSFLGSYFNSRNGPGWEVGADLSLEIPRFVAPFGLSNLVPKRMNPKTLFSGGTSFQRNIGLDRQTFTVLADYRWNYTPKKTIQLEIFNTQYIKNLNVGSYFTIYDSEYVNLSNVASTLGRTIPNSSDIDGLVNFMNDISTDNTIEVSNPDEFNTNLNILNRYNIITSDFLIPTIAYSFTYNNQTSFRDNSFSFFKIRVANSGNFLGLLSNKTNSKGKKTFLQIPLAQYFKTDIEYKKFWDLGNNDVFGIRTFLGAIITYDNSDIPFTKSYFAGGSNDIRAWQTYELGPGRRNTGLEFNVGSLKFLTSAEYRFGIIGKLKGALFADAGNIWDITGSDLVDQESKFNSLSSLADLAVGSGFGLRLDFNFLIARLDVGFKVHEPYLKGNKWFQNFGFSGAVYNIGINYPF